MNINELNKAAEAAYESFQASFREWLKTDKTSAYTPNAGATVGVVSCLVSNGSANGRSGRAYRYNYKISGKRCTALQAAAKLSS